jgi:dTDP-4-amino-4,6-dideoxygalactose transaminase
MINVTKTYAPSFQKYVKYLEGIWERRWFTNHGPLVNELEESLKSFLGVKHLFFVTNGTIALQIAIKALELQGKIATTPFSYVATTSSIHWESCKAVFADIDPRTFNISVPQLMQLKDPEIQAIMGVHVYGNPCDVTAIENLSKSKNWKVIYDAAHAFNVKVNNKSVLNFGDISTLSFHSTKVFHTIEGGAIVTSDDELAHKISYMRNFGHNGKEDFYGVGVNGKCSEFQAAMGLCMLEDYPKLEEMRQEKHNYYDVKLKEAFDSGELVAPIWHTEANRNYGYYPILFRTQEELLSVKTGLENYQIFPRRYFYPSLTTLPYVDSNSRCNISEDVSTRMLCLPLYPELRQEEQKLIVDILKRSLLSTSKDNNSKNTVVTPIRKSVA